MKKSLWFLHPIVVLVVSIVALATSLFLYIYWYMEVSSGLKAIMRRFDLDSSQVLASQTWIVILVLSLLVGLILMGTFIAFAYNFKTLQLYRLQNNFINNFTHELKTPVTSLKLYLETFRKHRLPREDQLKYLDYMIQDAGLLTATINSLLDLARIESKSYVGEFAPKDLARTVEDFFAENVHLFENCRVTVDYPKDTSFLYRIDPVLFDMLLMNLATNAVKYHPSRTPAISVTLTKGRRRILVEFQDDGTGLEARELKRVFKKFYQVGRADNVSAKGTGIGLYMAQCIARLHGGRLSARSRGPGTGCTFTLTLPDKYSME